jgi:hypothetical protein
VTARSPARGRNALLAVTIIGLGTVLWAGACDPTAVWSAPPASATPATASSPAPAPAPTPVAAVIADPCHQGAVVYCVLNPAVTEATIRSTICVWGWTATADTHELHRASQAGAAGGQGPGAASAYEEDHRVPLELGGSPSDPLNLSPEPRPGSYSKDAAENAARSQVCAGSDLRAVQAAFVSRWLEPYPGYR